MVPSTLKVIGAISLLGVTFFFGKKVATWKQWLKFFAALLRCLSNDCWAFYLAKFSIINNFTAIIQAFSLYYRPNQKSLQNCAKYKQNHGTKLSTSNSKKVKLYCIISIFNRHQCKNFLQSIWKKCNIFGLYNWLRFSKRILKEYIKNKTFKNLNIIRILYFQWLFCFFFTIKVK